MRNWNIRLLNDNAWIADSDKNVEYSSIHAEYSSIHVYEPGIMRLSNHTNAEHHS